MTLIEKIESLEARENLNNRQFALKSGIPYNTIRNFWIQGVDNMRLTTFKTLCDFFGVTMDSMAYDDKEIEYISDRRNGGLSPEEDELLSSYGRLNDTGRNEAIKRLDELAQIAAYRYKDAALDGSATGRLTA